MATVLYTIGEISKLVNVTANTLRYYDEIQLIQPVVKNKDTGYRFYSENQIKDLLKIQEWKYYGFGLHEIKRLLGAEPDKDVVSAALHQKWIELKQRYEADGIRIKVLSKKMEELGMDQNKLILLVECVAFERMVMREILFSYGYTNVVEAVNGEEGLRLFQERKPDLVITGVTMPVMDGLYMFMKTKEQYKTAKFIFCTAMNQVYIVLEALRTGCFDFIAKPIQAERLVASVMKAFEQKDCQSVSSKRLKTLENYVETLDTDLVRNLRLYQTEIDWIMQYVGFQGETETDLSYLKLLTKRYEREINETGKTDSQYLKSDIEQLGIDFTKIPLTVALQKEVCSQIIDESDRLGFGLYNCLVDFVWDQTIDMYITSNSENTCYAVRQNDELVGGFCLHHNIPNGEQMFESLFAQRESTILKENGLLSIEKAESIILQAETGYILSTFQMASGHTVFFFVQNHLFITHLK